MTKHDKHRATDILGVILDFQTEYHHPPSVRDIQVRVGLASTSAVHHHLTRLEREGSIVKCACGCGRYSWAAA
jgi:SOS-response transcriptional repressor LexA